MISSSSIFLIEDNEQDELLALRALKRHKVANHVLVARDGAEAVEMLANLEELPRVVLLDLKLPKLGGLEVLRMIRGNPITEKLPVVILTTSNEEKDVRGGYELGANSYIRKPVDFDEFAEVVKTLGSYWLELNVAPPSSERPLRGVQATD